MKKLSPLVVLALVGLAMTIGTASASPPSGQTLTGVTLATLGKFEAQGEGVVVVSKGQSADIAIAKVVLEPGGSTGWHHIPGVTLVSVAAGTAAVYDERCDRTEVTPGEGFIEEHNESHVVRNEGGVDLVLYTTLITATSVIRNPPARIEDPAICSVT
jgi:quercetin dioxygenase-like cupin family protein